MGQSPFVLIRGLLRDARHWGNFKQLLQQRFPNTPVLALDLPGNGALNQQTSSDNISDMTESLREQIRNRRNLRLIAISMGGMIAIDWITRYPNEVQSAVLINSSLRNLSPFYHRLHWKAYSRLTKIILFAVLHTKPDFEADILALTSNHHSQDIALLKRWQQWQQQNPVSHTNAINQCLAAAKFSNTFQLHRPVLVVSSKMDRLVDCRCSAKLAKVLDVPHFQHQTAGHDLPLDAPEWLVKQIEQQLPSTR